MYCERRTHLYIIMTCSCVPPQKKESVWILGFLMEYRVLLTECRIVICIYRQGMNEDFKVL